MKVEGNENRPYLDDNYENRNYSTIMTNPQEREKRLRILFAQRYGKAISPGFVGAIADYWLKVIDHEIGDVVGEIEGMAKELQRKEGDREIHIGNVATIFKDTEYNAGIIGLLTKIKSRFNRL